MDILGHELAKILNITIDKGIELYPILKGQFVAYKVLILVSTVFTVLWIGTLVCLIVAILIYNVNKEHIGTTSDYWRQEGEMALFCKNTIKPLMIFLIVSFIIAMSLRGSIYMLAPDFMIIKEFMV